MKVITISPTLGAGITEMENTLGALQHVVGGYIEVVPLTSRLAVICNEEGKLRNLEPAAWLTKRGGITPVDALCGDLVICRTTEDGEFDSLQDEDAAEIALYLHPVTRKGV